MYWYVKPEYSSQVDEQQGIDRLNLLYKLLRRSKAFNVSKESKFCAAHCSTYENLQYIKYDIPVSVTALFVEVVNDTDYESRHCYPYPGKKNYFFEEGHNRYIWIVNGEEDKKLRPGVKYILDGQVNCAIFGGFYKLEIESVEESSGEEK